MFDSLIFRFSTCLQCSKLQYQILW